MIMFLPRLRQTFDDHRMFLTRLMGIVLFGLWNINHTRSIVYVKAYLVIRFGVQYIFFLCSHSQLTIWLYYLIYFLAITINKITFMSTLKLLRWRFNLKDYLLGLLSQLCNFFVDHRNCEFIYRSLHGKTSSRRFANQFLTASINFYMHLQSNQ